MKAELFYKKLYRHLVNYIFIPIAAAFLLLLFIFHDQPIMQFQLVIIFAFIYVTSALLHHYNNKSLTFEIIIEYILIAVLSLIILEEQLL